MILSKEEKSLFKKVFKFIEPFKFNLIIIYISTILSNILALLPLYYMGIIIDSIVNKNISDVKLTILKLIVIFTVTSIFSLFETYFSNVTINKISKNIKDEIYNNSIYYKMTEFDKVNPGKLLSTIENDTIIIGQFFISDILNTIVALLTLIVSIFFIIKMSWILSTIALISFPITFLGYIFFGKKSKKYSSEIRNIRDKYFRFFHDYVKSIKQIKCLNAEDYFVNKHESITRVFSEKTIILANIGMVSSLFSLTITSISEWIIMLVAAYLIIETSLTIGAYVAFNGYFSKFMNSMRGLLNINITLQTTSVSINRVYDLLNNITENFEDNALVASIGGDISIKNVDFKYSNNGPEIIKNLTTEFKENTISVIVGRNGEGKTTLFDLIVNLYDIDKGEILYGEINQKSVPKRVLRDSISYIHQNPIIFNDSFIENFRLMDRKICNEEIEKYCKIVELDSYINKLPDKYNSIIGNSGVKLSGGERQKLAIALALAKKSNILLLDEITSDLDGNSENSIIKILKNISKDHTIIMISHRLTSIINIPNIYVFNNGRIVDNGEHQYLIKNCKEYLEIIGEMKEVWETEDE